jgi:hypothetical protein
MSIACAAAGFGSSVGAISGFESGATHARQGSHSAQLWGSGWGKGSASPTRLSRRAGKPGKQQRGQGNRTRPQQEGRTEMSQDIVKAMVDIYGNVSFGGARWWAQQQIVQRAHVFATPKAKSCLRRRNQQQQSVRRCP